MRHPARRYKQSIWKRLSLFKRKFPHEKTLKKAEVIAYELLTNFSWMKKILLTGSTAQGFDGHDIDLVILYQGKSSDLMWYDLEYPSKNKIKTLKKIAEKISDNIPVDLFFADERVLYDCDYLENNVGPNMDCVHNFYNGIFCHRLLLRFNPVSGQFDQKVSHTCSR